MKTKEIDKINIPEKYDLYANQMDAFYREDNPNHDWFKIVARCYKLGFLNGKRAERDKRKNKIYIPLPFKLII